MGYEGGGGAAARLLALAIWGTSLWAPAHAEPAAPSAQVEAQVEALLAAGIEPGEARQAIVALGSAGELALMAVFEREAAERYVRLRALSVLSSFETETAARYFARLVEVAGSPDARLGALHPARSPLVLRRALEGLVPTGHLLSPPPNVGAIGGCLDHPDAHVRKAAARLLATFDDGKSQSALTTRLARERSRMVRGSLESALTSRSVRRSAPR